MEHPVSLPCSQKPAICPNPEPNYSIQRAPILFLMFVLILSPPFMPRSSKRSLSFKFHGGSPVCISRTRAICLTHHILLDLVTLMKQQNSWSFSSRIFLHSPFNVLSLRRPNIFLSNPISKTPSLLYSPNMRASPSKPYKVGRKTAVVRLLIFTFQTAHGMPFVKRHMWLL